MQCFGAETDYTIRKYFFDEDKERHNVWSLYINKYIDVPTAQKKSSNISAVNR